MTVSRRLREQGFTLLELLISLTLLGLILVLLFGGLRLGVRSWDASQKQIDNLNSIRSLEGFLRRELSLVYPYVWTNSVDPRLAFLGEQHKVSFVAQLPSRLGTGGLYLISVELEKTSNAQRIVWRQKPLDSREQDFSSLSQSEGMVLASFVGNDMEDIWLSYYGRNLDGVESRWNDNWENRISLPSLIRVKVKLANDVVEPDFVVAPLLSLGTAK